MTELRPAIGVAKEIDDAANIYGRGGCRECSHEGFYPQLAEPIITADRRALVDAIVAMLRAEHISSHASNAKWLFNHAADLIAQRFGGTT